MSFWSWLFGEDEEEERKINYVPKDFADFSNSDDDQNLKFLEIAKVNKQFLHVWQLMKQGGAVDVIPGATGDFGHDITNPIPVNGTSGELTYLSRLLTSSGEKIFFHRLGSIDIIDVFETVSQSGDEWDILFVDFYHTRKTRQTPKNYKFQKDKSGRPFTTLIRGIDGYVEDFPRSFYKILRTQITSGMKMLPDPDAEKIVKLRRPKDQTKIVKERMSFTNLRAKSAENIRQQDNYYVSSKIIKMINSNLNSNAKNIFTLQDKAGAHMVCLSARRSKKS